MQRLKRLERYLKGESRVVQRLETLLSRDGQCVNCVARYLIGEPQSREGQGSDG